MRQGVAQTIHILRRIECIAIASLIRSAANYVTATHLCIHSEQTRFDSVRWIVFGTPDEYVAACAAARSVRPCAAVGNNPREVERHRRFARAATARKQR